MDRIKILEKRIRVFIAYGDITGFTTWASRTATSHEDYRWFLKRLYIIFRTFERRTGYYVKFLADGFFAVREMEKHHNCGVAKDLLKALWDVRLDVVALIDTLPVDSRPEDFRVRVASGMVSKIIMQPFKKGGATQVEYIGASTVLGDRVLEIERNTSCMCTDGVIAFLKKTEKGIVVEKLKIAGRDGLRVDPNDLLHLNSYRVVS